MTHKNRFVDFNEGLWYQIVVTYDNNTQITKIYLKQEGKDMNVLYLKKIDQQPGIGTIRDRGVIRVRPQYFFIGYSGLLGSENDYFIGDISDFMIFNKKLEIEDIKKLPNTLSTDLNNTYEQIIQKNKKYINNISTNTKLPGLVAHYTLDEFYYEKDTKPLVYEHLKRDPNFDNDSNNYIAIIKDKSGYSNDLPVEIFDLNNSFFYKNKDYLKYGHRDQYINHNLKHKIYFNGYFGIGYTGGCCNTDNENNQYFVKSNRIINSLPIKNDPFTISVWIKPESVKDHESELNIVQWGWRLGYGDEADDRDYRQVNAIQLYRDESHTNPNFSIKHILDNNDCVVNVGDLTNKWTHIAVTYDGIERNIYINGIIMRRDGVDTNYRGGPIINVNADW